jgi:hypothetical protein
VVICEVAQFSILGLAFLGLLVPFVLVDLFSEALQAVLVEWGSSVIVDY